MRITGVTVGEKWTYTYVREEMVSFEAHVDAVFDDDIVTDEIAKGTIKNLLSEVVESALTTQVQEFAKRNELLYIALRYERPKLIKRYNKIHREG